MALRTNIQIFSNEFLCQCVKYRIEYFIKSLFGIVWKVGREQIALQVFDIIVFEFF